MQFIKTREWQGKCEDGIFMVDNKLPNCTYIVQEIKNYYANFIKQNSKVYNKYKELYANIVGGWYK